MSEGAERPRKSAGDLWRRNGLIWAALMCLLGLTLVLAYVPLGRLNTPVGIAIAFAKAGLVVVLFMELAGARALIRLTACAGLVFVLVLFSLTFSDVLSRYASK